MLKWSTFERSSSRDTELLGLLEILKVVRCIGLENKFISNRYL